MKKQISFYIHRFFSFFLFAVILGITECASPLYADTPKENLIADPHFKDAGKWSLPAGYSIVPNAGKDGQNALMLEKTDPAGYPLGLTSVPVAPGSAYEIGAYIKGENIDGSATIAGEFYDAKGQILDGGTYPTGFGGTFDWTLVKDKIYVPDGAATCNLILYMRPNATGKVWFSQPFFREIQGEFDAYLLEPAMPERIVAGKRDVIFGLIPPDNKPYENCRIVIRQNNKEAAQTVSQVQKNRVIGTLEVPMGSFEFHLTLQKQGKPAGEITIPATGISQEELQKTAVYIDNRGRTIVRGKKFFPIGVFMNHLDPRCDQHDLKTDLDIIAKGKFNCIMPYDAPLWKAAEDAAPSIAYIRKMLDYADSIGLKLLFSVKDIRGEAEYYGIKGEYQVIEHIVKSLRDHPSILAWYVIDEDPVIQRAQFVARNRFINKLDPTHPTWAAFDKFNQLTPRYGGSGTVYGLDPYPISHPFNMTSKNQKNVVRALDAGHASFQYRDGMALWMVPQIFSWGVYYTDRFSEFRYPSEVEMRSMMMMDLIGGAKGIVMYSYHDLFAKPDGRPQFERRWPEICRITDLLTRLQDYILGDPKGPTVNVKAQIGDVRAAGFTNDDNQPAILISSVGPGESKAVLHIDTAKKLKSLYGRTVKQSDGSWLFTGQDIDSDVLLPE